MKKKELIIIVSIIFSLAALYPCVDAQNKAATSVTAIKKQKQAADKEINETKRELTNTERKVTETLTELRQIEDDIAASQREIATVKGNMSVIKDTITSLETGIQNHERDLENLRSEYLKAVKKMRVARKKNSGLVFLFASGSFNEARRRMRYMHEFSDWRGRRSEEITNKVKDLHNKRQHLVQAREDLAVALNREQTAQNKLSGQRTQQQNTVIELRANSEALKSKLAKRQAEAKLLSGQISRLIAEQQAKEAQEAQARKKAEEERRLLAEKQAAEKAAAEKAAAQKKAEEEKLLAQQNAKSKNQEKGKGSAKQSEVKTPQNNNQPDKSEYAAARRRRSRSAESTPTSPAPTATATTATKTPSAASSAENKTAASPTKVPATAQSAATGFAGMKGNLPKPVNGSFKIVSAFGVHPISPELPDIMDENLGIDAHVAKGASACAVYDGEVIKVYDRTTTPGFRNIVVVKHGDYITVYANLETLAVKTGQHVKQGQGLGTVGNDFDDPAHGMIHFEVWKNQTHLDPSAWLR